MTDSRGKRKGERMGSGEGKEIDRRGMEGVEGRELGKEKCVCLFVFIYLFVYVCMYVFIHVYVCAFIGVRVAKQNISGSKV